MYIKNIILFISVILCLASCRYKDNDKLIIATVKQRIEKTWYLKEYTLNDVEKNVNYISTLKITLPTKKLINIDCNNSGIYTQYLFDNKTVIKTKDETGRELKITKLTRDELWLNGYRIIPTDGVDIFDKIIAKYSSKP